MTAGRGDCDWVVCIRLIYPEARAALAQAERLGRLTAGQLRGAATELDPLFEEIELIEVDDALARRAVNCAGMTRSTSRPPNGSVTRTSS